MRKDPNEEVNSEPGNKDSATSDQHAGSILHNIHIAFIRTGKALDIQYVNPYALQLWATPYSNILHKDLMQVFPAFLMAEGKRALQDMLSSPEAGGIYTYEHPDRFMMLQPFADGYIIAYIHTQGAGIVSPYAVMPSDKVQLLEMELIALKKSRQQEIFKAIIDTQEQERRRIAENLHVEIGQLLSAVKMQLDHQSSHETEKMINDAIRKVRAISFELMPSLLRDFGLESALRDMIEKKLTAAGIQSTLNLGVPEKQRNDEINLVIFRIIQELINNIIRHAGATHVVVHVRSVTKGIQVLVRDNGRGINPEQIRYGFGLLSIQNRVQMMQGTFQLTTGENEFLINIILPHVSTDEPVDKGIAD